MSMFRAYHQGTTAAAAAVPTVDGSANRNMVPMPGDLSLVYPHAAAAAAWNFNMYQRGGKSQRTTLTGVNTTTILTPLLP